MFDIGWTEIVFAAVIALVVLGPRELPHALRLLGKWTRSIRHMASEFRHSLDLAADMDHHPTAFERSNKIGGDQEDMLTDTVLTDTMHNSKMHDDTIRDDTDQKKYPSEEKTQASSLRREKTDKKSSD